MGQQAKKNFPMGYLSPIKKKNTCRTRCGFAPWSRILVAIALFPCWTRNFAPYTVRSSPKGVPAIGFRGNRVMNFSVASGLGEALPSLLASLFRAVYAFRVTWSERFSSRIRHRNELTEKAWEDAVQGLGKGRQGGAQE